MQMSDLSKVINITHTTLPIYFVCECVLTPFLLQHVGIIMCAGVGPLSPHLHQLVIPDNSEKDNQLSGLNPILPEDLFR